mmetsp:Transcript_44101/g.47756  ORF Transcript_44101/g.47756 Transcript_44101/m.47756 type:complete len:546 (+) Transcript_44101:276-1913(+)
MKFSVSFSLFASSIAVSSSASEAFASNGRTRTALSFGVPTKQKHHLSRSQHTAIDINSSRTNRNNLSFVRGGARYESTTTDSSSEVFASVVRGGSLESGTEKVNIVQSLASKPLTKAILSSTLFVLTDMIIKTIFKAKSISFPSSLAGCCFLAATLLTTPFHETLYRVLNPGAKLMQKFMMIFLVPNLIILPLCGGSYSVMEMSKIMGIILGGFLFSLLSTCYSVMAVSKIFGTNTNNNASTGSTENAAGTKTIAPKPKAFSDELTYGSRALAAASGIAAVASNSMGSTITTPLLAFSMLAVTFHNFAFGARQSKKFTKAIHPLVSCTVLSWFWATLLGSLTGGSFYSMLRGYRVGGALSLATSGAGDFLTFVLGPAVVSLGVSIYERRALMKQNYKEVLTATGVSCVGGLFGTALAVRLLRLASAELRLSMLPRNITSALAVAIAEIIGANKSLAVAIAIVTGLIGANFGATLLDLFGIKDPVVRGLGIGSAAHGLGAAAFVEEKDAFPFAAISMALTAICGTLFVSIPSVKALAIKIALGGLT